MKRFVSAFAYLMCICDARRIQMDLVGGVKREEDIPDKIEGDGLPMPCHVTAKGERDLDLDQDGATIAKKTSAGASSSSSETSVDEFSSYPESSVEETSSYPATSKANYRTGYSRPGACSGSGGPCVFTADGEEIPADELANSTNTSQRVSMRGNHLSASDSQSA
mmetsp:Transcript_109483/g.172614  ORF Transcript_109483/g.172614 Transcript_109483/m.172614 type:complete len:165 (+) Transcript_109483:67-561(+)